jgi:hypothetical protein
MADTAPGKSNSIESPAPPSKASASDKHAPQKFYPGSAELVKKDGGKPGATIDSPTSEKVPGGLYHKGRK